ncbi:MAG: SAM-dependent methyltransferase [Acidobacteriia bacterium]|nr:SAM-dependent methyltransferase [Terriglobia bacterium]
MTLREYIEREIRERGPLPFSRYMALCLSGAPAGDPPGFYSRAREQFGKAGDFYTSSDVHAVFGRLLARQFDEMWRALDSPPRIDLVELGPGRGLLAQDVLDWTARKFPHFALALRYTLVEGSPELARRLQERFADRIARGKVEVLTGFDDFRRHYDHAIVFANEFFDALPVEIVSDRGQVYVGAAKGRFEEIFRPLAPEVDEFLDRYGVRPEAGERVEACTEAVSWMKRLAAVMRRGFAVFIDYGYTREEQLAGRHRDTLMTYRRHQAGTNPYEAPGEQDITAHVNFTALSESSAALGFDPLALVTQAQFLMGIGEENQFADAFEECQLPQERAKVALQLKHIATPVGMGEVFDVLVLGRGVTKETARGLSGLKFAKGS